MKRTYYAPAKINLWLRVFESDATGYHPLDTMFCALDMCDRIDVQAGVEGIHLRVSGADVGPVENNLAFRAAHDFFATLGIPPAIDIELIKNIPAGAGLGGGSSDAATVLRALQELQPNKLPHQDLLAIAARLGSDVPFFLCGSSFAHATGRGEILKPVPPLPSRPVIVVIPEFAISTRTAYEWLDDSGSLRQPDAAAAPAGSWSDVAKRARNDFEPVLFARHPVLHQIRDRLVAEAAAIALVSGSGSALFGVFEDADAASAAQQALQREFSSARVVATRTLD